MVATVCQFVRLHKQNLIPVSCGMMSSLTGKGLNNPHKPEHDQNLHFWLQTLYSASGIQLLSTSQILILNTFASAVATLGKESVSVTIRVVDLMTAPMPGQAK